MSPPKGPETENKTIPDQTRTQEIELTEYKSLFRHKKEHQNTHEISNTSRQEKRSMIDEEMIKSSLDLGLTIAVIIVIVMSPNNSSDEKNRITPIKIHNNPHKHPLQFWLPQQMEKEKQYKQRQL
jgi:hypothetical protein